MNFFERQDAARRQSKRLVLLFALAVLAIVAAVDLVLLLAFGVSGEDGGGNAAGMAVGLSLATLLTLAVIGGASLFRVAQLREGGAAIARQLGGTPVPEDTTDFQLRRLRNVVEEIAIASGVPVPQIFVLDDEAAINAFAAGYAPSDAAVTVTRGALNRLNRDELQGVIAHEFSHVLNGDMRLNIRLVGLLFGILVLALIGRKILEHGRFRGKDGAPILVMALAFMVIGYVGLFCARLIKAGVSRQREYLADASAVQFTRQTRGIAGALKKIAGLAEGSRLGRSDGEEVSHMLFGDGVGYSSLMATHPPLFARIKALEPSFKPEAMNDLVARWSMKPPVGSEEDLAMGLSGGGAFALPAERAQLQVTPPAVVSQVGAPQADDYRRASAMNEAIPEVLQRAARDRDEAPALLYGLLHAPAGKARDHQQYELIARTDERSARQALDYADRVVDLHPMLRLPLAALAFPVLRRRPRPELQQFSDTVYALIHADGEVSLFEYCLGRLLQTQVTESLDPARAWVPGNRRLAAVATAATCLLAVLAQAGHAHPSEAQRAYLAGLAHVFPRLNAPYAPPAKPLQALDELWPVLDALEPTGKELLIEGLVAAISSDGHVAVAEAELLRAVCASLHCPLPPMLEQPESYLS
jgi:Zn-dependent protease with chaperone function